VGRLEDQDGGRWELHRTEFVTGERINTDILVKKHAAYGLNAAMIVITEFIAHN